MNTKSSMWGTMKRLFFILFFFCIILTSCQGKYGILDYQNKDILAVCTVNGKYKVEIAKTKELCKITVQEPENIKGISFEIGERTYTVYGDNKIESSKESLDGICALADIFSQSEECLTTAKEEGQGSVLTFQKEECTYKLTIGKNSLPKYVHILSNSFEYNVEILTIELQ